MVVVGSLSFVSFAFVVFALYICICAVLVTALWCILPFPTFAAFSCPYSPSPFVCGLHMEGDFPPPLILVPTTTSSFSFVALHSHSFSELAHRLCLRAFSCLGFLCAVGLRQEHNLFSFHLGGGCGAFLVSLCSLSLSLMPCDLCPCHTLPPHTCAHTHTPKHTAFTHLVWAGGWGLLCLLFFVLVICLTAPFCF